MTITFQRLGQMGWMANQLFQIATTISCALSHNDNYTFPPWGYESCFNLRKCFSTNTVPTKTFTEQVFHYTPLSFPDAKNEIIDLVGYFQSWRYIHPHEEVIKKLLSPVNPYPMKSGTTGLHVRRSDYSDRYKKEFIQLADEDYYEVAMSRANTNRFLIVSDDIEYCKTRFTGNQFDFCETDTVIDDFKHLLSCENQIISNGSFSWMAAWLNPNPSKIVIASKNWFGASGTMAHNDTKDLLWPEWVKI